jgi:SAM-dependent methyltransferase
MVAVRRCLSFVAPNFHGPVSHLPFTHRLWEEIVAPGDTLIDATCGNGHDSLYLAKLLSQQENRGRLYCIDLQGEAVASTRKRLSDNPAVGSIISSHVSFIHHSHETFPDEITPGSVGLICYNLGYLPGKPRAPVGLEGATDTAVITKPHTTLTSLRNALPLLRQGGLLSVVAYPGHEGGQDEVDAVEKFMRGLDDQVWRAYGNFALNKPKLPIVFSAYRIDKRPRT